MGRISKLIFWYSCISCPRICEISFRINLDEGEWATLVEHFDKVKAVMQGEEVNLRGCKQSHDADEIVKVCPAEWFLNDELLNTD